MANVAYRELKGRAAAFHAALLAAAALAGLGVLAAWYMEENGHVVTGMNNQIVWGMPHVFAVFLIVAGSGALNVATIGSVFGRVAYKPLARLSGLSAIALLIGGLAVLVLDLGRPDRLIVAMTSYNFKSIFAWNIFLYTGFIFIAAVYLWTMMERRANRFGPACGLLMFLWRLGLTTGTGLIFGFLTAREAYDAAVMGPLFIAMSFSFGLAVFILVMFAACSAGGRPVGDQLIGRLGRLLGVFVAAVLYFVLVQHLTNLYAAEHTGVERFILADGGVITWLFWGGQVALGGLLPLALLLRPGGNPAKGRVSLAALLVIAGGMAQVYVIIIGGQAYPLDLFPGLEERSGFFDGVVNAYSPSLPEMALGVGGAALAAVIVMLGIRTLRFLPDSLSDARTGTEPAPAE